MNSKFNIIYEKCLNDIVSESNLLKKLGIIGAAGVLATTPLVAKSYEQPKNDSIVNVDKSEYDNLIESAENFIKNFEKTVKNDKQEHIAYDDLNPSNRWNEKDNIDTFIKGCKGKPTIGYGETSLEIIKKGKINENEAESLIKNRIINIDKQLSKKFPKYSTFNINQKTALISFYYNLGINFNAPKMVKFINDDKFIEGANEMLDCDNVSKIVNGKKILYKLPGLTKRRQLEHDLFLKINK